MNSRKIISSNKIVDGNVVTVTETIEQVYTKNELMQQMYNHTLNQNSIKEQMKNLKAEYDRIDLIKAELEEIIAQLDTDDLPSVD